MSSAAIDNDNLGQAFASLRRGLLATVRRQVRDPQLAEDLVQEVFVKAVKAVRKGRAPGNLAAWLHAAARTTVIDSYRARKLDTEPLHEEPAAPEPADDQRFQVLAACMEPLVRALPMLYRDALLAADIHGQPLAALAEGRSVSAIKSRVSRGRAMLREKLLACCEVEWTGGQVVDFTPRQTCGGCKD